VWLPQLTPEAWLWLLLAAALVGFAKTAINGVGALAVVLFAFVLPVKESTGALLPLLLVGDVLAVGLYRRHADLRALLRLLLGVLPGLVLGWWFIGQVDDALMRRSIAVILIVMTGLQLWQRRRGTRDALRHPRAAVTLATGATAGFATMTANAAGPVTTLYLIRAGLPTLEMLGTAAWFYLAVNLSKLPFSAGLHLISVESLAMGALLVPALLLGGWVGVRLIRRVDQRQFEVAALLLGGAAAGLLLV